ncbi:MAG: hypothetical protein WCP22_13165 [Chlamydiota bacterium]
MRMMAVITLAVLVLAAPCYGGGLFSFFNPEVTTPIEVKPINSDISGMKTTITLGSLGSVITAHLALVIMGFLLYAAIRRIGREYQNAVTLIKEKEIAERMERMRLKAGWLPPPDRANNDIVQVYTWTGEAPKPNDKRKR